jgi:hypothetical protein
MAFIKDALLEHMSSIRMESGRQLLKATWDRLYAALYDNDGYAGNACT